METKMTTFRSTRKSISLIMVMMLLSVFSYAQTYDLFFWVSAGSPMGVMGAEVTIGDETLYTDFDGLAVFEGYAPGDYDYTVSLEGYFDDEGTATLVDANLAVYISLEEEVYDLFFWVNAGSPFGVMGAAVTIGNETLYTDFDGLAVFEGYAPGDYDYTVSLEGYFDDEGTATLVDANLAVYISLEEEVYDLFFWVTAGGPMGVQDAAVTIGDETLYTDFDGLAVFEGYAPGDYDYTVSLDGYFDDEGTATLVDANLAVYISLEEEVYDLFFWVTAGGPMGVQDAAVTIGDETLYTDFDGLAVFEGYVPGDYDYTVSLEGYFDDMGTATLVDENLAVFVNLELEVYDLFFWVTAGGPMGVQDAAVTIGDETLYTDFDGLAVFEGLTPGDYDYTVSLEGYFDDMGTATLVDENLAVFVNLELEVYDIYFWVQDEEEDAIEGAAVTIEGETVYTDFNGMALFETYAPGSYDYTIVAAGYYDLEGMIEVVEDVLIELVEMEMEVYDIFFWVSAGGPMGVEGAAVTIGDVTVYSDFDGLALFEAYPAGDYEYMVSLEDYFDEEGVVTVVDENVAVFVNLSNVAFDIFFWVSAGGPMGVEGAEVTIGNETVSSDFDGLALFENYTPGDYDYTVFLEGYIQETGTVTVTDENVAVYVNLQPALYDIFFWVTAGGPMGVEGAAVTIGDATVYTDFDGLALFEGYAPGDYDYTVSLEGYLDNTGTATLVDENIQVMVNLLEDAYDIFFWVTAGGPMGVEGAAVTIGDQTEYTDFDGLAILAYFAPGDYEYTVSLEGYYDATGTVTVVDENVQVMINLTPLPTYSITFVIDDGTYPIEGAEVEINSEIMVTNADGEAVFMNMDPGTYLYTVSMNGYIAEDGVVTVVDEDMMVEVTLITTGIEQLEKEIKVYPNPSYGLVNVENSKGSRVYVVDLTGSVVFSSELDNDRFTINISNQPAGLYMIQLISEFETKTVKLILQK